MVEPFLRAGSGGIFTFFKGTCVLNKGTTHLVIPPVILNIL